VTGIRSITVKVVIAVVISLLMGVVIFNTMVNKLPGDVIGYTADFKDVAGLRVGDDVRLAGVRVGRVEDIELGGSGALVKFNVTKSNPMLSNTALELRYQNLLGQRYLSMVQPEDLGSVVKEGKTIPVANTDPGFDLTALLNGFRPLFEALNPDDMNQLASSMIKVMQGEGGTAETLLQQTAELTSSLADKDEVFGEVVTNLTPVLTNMASQGEQFTATVTELKALMTGLAEDRESIGSSIDGMSQLITTTSELLAEANKSTPETVRKFRRIMENWMANRDDFVKALGYYSGIVEAFGRSHSYENAMNTYFCSIDLDLLGLTVNLAGPRAGNYSKNCGG
jgi:phospholipid/cholesterol/gamma-HCH transport system substrate-binding protein